jgi:hypothetical protein
VRRLARRQRTLAPHAPAERTLAPHAPAGFQEHTREGRQQAARVPRDGRDHHRALLQARHLSQLCHADRTNSIGFVLQRFDFSSSKEICGKLVVKVAYFAYKTAF